MYRSTYFWNYLEVSGQLYSPAASPPGKKPRNPLHRGWMDPRRVLNDMEEWKFLSLSGLELWPLVIQAVAIRYTDCATAALTRHWTYTELHVVHALTPNIFQVLISSTRRGGAVGKATGYKLHNWGVVVRVPIGSRILMSPHGSGLLWGPPSFLSSGYREGSLSSGKTTEACSCPLTSN
jgi:hypothetical protein